MEIVLPSSIALFLNSETYLTVPLYSPNVENDCMEVTKFRKFPISAYPSAPIKTAIAFEVKNPANILIKTETELNDAILIKTLLLI